MTTSVLPPPSHPQSRLLAGFDIGTSLYNTLKSGSFLSTSTNFFLSPSGSKTFSIRLFGLSQIWTCSQENIRALLSSQSSDFEQSKERLIAFQPYVGNGILSSNGDTWAHARQMLRPCFKNGKIIDFDVYERVFGELRGCIEVEGKGKKTLDLQGLFARATIDVASELVFGKSLNCLGVRRKEFVDDDSGYGEEEEEDIEERRIAADAIMYSSHAIGARLIMGPMVWAHWDPKATHYLEILEKYVDRNIKAGLLEEGGQDSGKEYREDGKPKMVFMKELMKSTNDPKAIRDQLGSILGAGTDTLAALLSFVFYYLVRHEDVMERLRRDVYGLEGVPPGYVQLNGMSYLKWVVDETLRISPTVSFNGRSAKHDTILPTGRGPDRTSPISVKKGQMIICNVYALQRDKAVWGEDAEEFRPERWGEDTKPGWKFVPFGGGPGVCIGQQMALTQASYIIVRMLQTFEGFENRDEGPFVEQLGITLSSKNGVNFAVW